MPDFWSHRYAAKGALEQFLKNEPTHHVWSDFEEAAFIFGAQGPDFFYYINKWKPFSKVRYSHLGNALHHQNPEPLVRCLLEILKTSDSKVQKSYIAGFLSHYFMDVHCHPLICRLGPEHDTHKRVEMNLEALCIFDYWSLSRSSLDLSALKIRDLSQYEALGALWLTILEKIGLEPVSTDMIIDGHQSMLRIQKLIKKDLVRFIPGKKLLGKIVKYDLSLLILPRLDKQTLRATREYDSFVRCYTDGITETANSFACIEAIFSGKATIDDFIDTYVKRDFLGEVI